VNNQATTMKVVKMVNRTSETSNKVPSKQPVAAKMM
jgi:hypothetical protein